MDIIVPCKADISDFLCIHEGKWDVGNYHFDNEHIYGTNNKMENDCPFLHGTTHNDILVHIHEKEDHCFPMHEEGLLEVFGPIYDTNDGTSLTFPCPLQDPNGIDTLSISPCLALSHTITNIDEPFPSPEYGVEEEPLSSYIPSSQSYP